MLENNMLPTLLRHLWALGERAEHFCSDLVLYETASSSTHAAKLAWYQIYFYWGPGEFMP